MQHVIDVFNQNLQNYVDQATDRVSQSGNPTYTQLPRELLRGAIERAFRAMQSDLEQDNGTVFADYLRAVGTQRMQQGGNVTDILKGFNIGFEVVSEDLQIRLADDLAGQLWWERHRHQAAFASAVALAEQLITVRDDRIREQASQINTLSTPLVPVYQGVLAFPLVGLIDARRAEQVLEVLLEGIARHQADVVIIDITGVPSVDTEVANYLLQAAKAAQLLGAHVVLVGISPEIAQTIVQLGSNLSQLTTLANFQSGVEYALSQQGRAITEITPATDKELGWID